MVDLLQPGTLLYHGSYTVVERPSLEKCARCKDFGRGFYLTTSLEQAHSFAGLSTRKAISNRIVGPKAGRGHVSVFRYKPIITEPLDSFCFPTADSQWLHCVVAHRKESLFPELMASMTRYDVISGKIANDQTNATIVAYMTGLFGQPGSPEADETCIRLLIPERLHDQHCFRTARALESLTFEGEESPCLE